MSHERSWPLLEVGMPLFTTNNLPMLHPCAGWCKAMQRNILLTRKLAGKVVALLPEIVAVASLYDDVFLLGHSQMNFMVAGRVALVGRVGEAVLISQIL